MSKHVPRRGVMRRWLISYILILTVPLMSVIFSYTYAHRAIVREAEAANRQTLTGVMTGVDDVLSQMIYVTESLSVNTYFTQAQSAQRNQAKLLAVTPKLTATLRTLQRPFADMELLVYLPDADYLVASSTANSRALLEQTVQIIYDADVSGGFFPALDQPAYAGIFCVSGQYSYNSYGTPKLVYIRSISSGSLTVGTRYSTAVVNLSLDRILSQFGENGEQVVLAFDREGNYLFGTGADEETLASLPGQTAEEGQTVGYQVNGESYLGYQTASKVTGWTFVLLTRESSFWQSTHHLTVMFAVLLCSALAIGLLLMVFLLRFNYRPVRRTLSSLAPSGAQQGEDEFEVIQNSYAELLNQHMTVRRQLAIHQQTLIENYLFSHLHGSRESVLPDMEIQSFLQLNLNEKCFVIVSFALCGDAQPMIDPRLAEAAGNQDAAAFLIDSLFERRFTDRYVGYRLPHDQLYTWLLVLDAEQTEGFLESADERLSEMLEQLSRVLGVPVSALLSDVLENFDALPNAYQDIQDCCTYQCAAGAQGIVHVSSYRRRIERQNMRRREDEELELLCDAICARRPGDAAAVVTRMMNRLREQAAGSAWAERMRVCSWVCLLLDTEEIMSTVDAAAVEKQLLSLSRAESLDETGEGFLTLIRLLCGDIKPAGEGDGARLSNRLQKYIDDHYTDPNLSLYHLGEVFGLTSKYLSRLYRSETDGSLLEYLNTVRVKAACRLLERDEGTVEEIALAVGYTNVKTFRRAFQRIEGATPRSG